MLLPVSLTLAINCSPVSTTMAISCSPVSTTPPINFSTGDKLCWGQRSVLLCKAISGRWSQPRLPNSHEKAQRHLTHPDQRPRRPPKLLQTKTALFSFGGLRGLWSRCVGVYGCNFSWRFQWHRGRKNRRFIPFNFLLSLAAPHLHGVLVLVTGK